MHHSAEAPIDYTSHRPEHRVAMLGTSGSSVKVASLLAQTLSVDVFAPIHQLPSCSTITPGIRVVHGVDPHDIDRTDLVARYDAVVYAFDRSPAYPSRALRGLPLSENRTIRASSGAVVGSATEFVIGSMSGGTSVRPDVDELADAVVRGARLCPYRLPGDPAEWLRYQFANCTITESRSIRQVALAC